ncbi:recombinase family protein [Bacillus alveayuensis]|uniref:recombinase family protein n=1 Tax=Aeribacillus alveayuensis TaxID=279215 RepID=UPI0005CCDF4F|nr:recombinase family protein [Bacillus alveayuensis]
MNLQEFLKKPGLKAAFYGRYSDEDQDIETQRAVCQEFAREHGIEIIYEYIDESISAFKKTIDKRKNLNLMREDAKKGEFDCVLVYKGDRLARRIDQHLKIWSEFREIKVPIILTHSRMLYTTDDIQTLVVEIGMSSFESENNSIRTRDHYITHTKMGKWLGGTLPYGYRYEDGEDGEKKIVQIPLQIEKVKQIFELYIKGYGFESIAKQLDKQYPEDMWIKEKIKSIITNPVYAGFTTSQRIKTGSGNSLRPRKDWVMAKCDKISPAITEEVWNLCMDLYERKKEGLYDSKKFTTSFLFRDILFCKTCDVPLKGKNYTSGKKRKDGTRYANRKYICPNCKYKWNGREIDEYLSGYILAGLHYKHFTYKKEDVHQNEVLVSISEDIEKIKSVINSYEKELREFREKLNLVDTKQKQLMEENNEPTELQKALVQYRLSIRNRMAELEKEIEKKQKELTTIEKTYGDFENWKGTITELVSLEYDFAEPYFRRLVLLLFQKIEVDQNYKFNYIARVDLDERGTIDLGL